VNEFLLQDTSAICTRTCCQSHPTTHQEKHLPAATAPGDNDAQDKRLPSGDVHTEAVDEYNCLLPWISLADPSRPCSLGMKTEQRLWSGGLSTWEDALAAPIPYGRLPAEGLPESVRRHKRFDVAWFAAGLPTSQSW
jgi:hypothetical protein